MLSKIGRELQNSIKKFGDVLCNTVGDLMVQSNGNAKDSAYFVPKDDAKFNNLLSWAEKNPVEAEQLALDATRILSSTSERLEDLSNKNFFQRCWMRMDGEMGKLQSATTNDLISIQKMSLSYIDQLNQRQILQAHSILTIKNGLNGLAWAVEGLQDGLNSAVNEIGKNREMIYQNRQLIYKTQEELARTNRIVGDHEKRIQANSEAISETRLMVAELAKRVDARFRDMEKRIGKLEVSANIQGWLLTLSERQYEREYPASTLRLLRIINDFYAYKNDDFGDDLLFLKRALREVGIDPNAPISTNEFIDILVDELLEHDPFGMTYRALLNECKPKNIDNISEYMLNEVSIPFCHVLHELNNKFNDRSNVIEHLNSNLSITRSEALKLLLRNDIKGLNIDLDHKFALGDTAIEILAGMSLAHRLTIPANSKPVKIVEEQKPKAPDPKFFYGNDAVPLFTEILEYLCNPSIRIVEETKWGENLVCFYISKQVMSESHDLLESKGIDINYENMLQIFPNEIINTFSILYKHPIKKYDILLAVWKEGKIYIRLKNYKLFAFDLQNMKSGYIKANLQDMGFYRDWIDINDNEFKSYLRIKKDFSNNRRKIREYISSLMFILNSEKTLRSKIVEEIIDNYNCFSNQAIRYSIAGLKGLGSVSLGLLSGAGYLCEELIKFIFIGKNK